MMHRFFEIGAPDAVAAVQCSRSCLESVAEGFAELPPLSMVSAHEARHMLPFIEVEIELSRKFIVMTDAIISEWSVL